MNEKHNGRDDIDESRIYGEEEDEVALAEHHDAEVSAGAISNSNHSVGEDAQAQTNKKGKLLDKALTNKNEEEDENDEIDFPNRRHNSRKEQNEIEEDDEDILPSISSAR